ncbi:MAG: hypothetical protein OXI71_09805 [Gemmatimonadota bacterium]|nr:hypothetical protein [Gemmatimonadota bacterium]
MQSRRLPEEFRTKTHRWHTRRRLGGEAPGRSGARFAILAMAVGAIAMVFLSCGDGAVEPARPPSVPGAATVTVNPASATLTAIEGTALFIAEVRDQNGLVMAGAAVGWASGDASVVAVDAARLVTAAANRSATITATAGSVSGRRRARWPTW